MWSLSTVQCDRGVCRAHRSFVGVCFQRVDYVLPEAKDACISVFLLLTGAVRAYSGAKQSQDLITGLHNLIPSALTVFSLGLIQLSFYSVKGLPLSWRWTRSGRTEPVHTLGPNLPILKFKGQQSYGKSLPLTPVECGAEADYSEQLNEPSVTANTPFLAVPGCGGQKA